MSDIRTLAKGHGYKLHGDSMNHAVYTYLGHTLIHHRGDKWTHYSPSRGKYEGKEVKGTGHDSLKNHLEHLHGTQHTEQPYLDRLKQGTKPTEGGVAY